MASKENLIRWYNINIIISKKKLTKKSRYWNKFWLVWDKNHLLKKRLYGKKNVWISTL